MNNEQLNNQVVSFDLLADQLVEMKCTNHPSEIHGFLCGQLSAGLRPTEARWLQQIIEFSGSKVLSDSCINTVSHLYKATLEGLENQDYSFSLLVPDDDEALQPRVEALGIWCQSFLSGVGEGVKNKTFSTDVEEILKDFSEIAQIQSDIEDSEEAESNFVAINEYVRTTIMLVFLEGNHQDKAKISKSTLH